MQNNYVLQDEEGTWNALFGPSKCKPRNGSSSRIVPSMETLCRICGYKGTHSIHQRIPFFVHAIPDEATEWPDTIAKMISDLGGSEYGTIRTDDKLPQRICTVCISYMKHAMHFRNQAFLNLRECAGRLASPNAVDSTTTDCAGDVTKFFKSNCVATSNANNHSQQTNAMIDTERLRRDIDDFFAEELTASAAPTTSTSASANTTSASSSTDDDNDDDDDDEEDFNMVTGQRKRAVISHRQSRRIRNAIHAFFNYTETPFAEEDVNTMLGHSGAARINVRQPLEKAKERKCYACKRQFLVNQSYNDHVKQCVQVRLVEFVNGCQRMIQMHQDRIVSEQEFIRRMVFAVKSITKALAMCYRGTKTVSLDSADTKAGQKMVKDVPKQMFNATNSTVAKDWWPEPPQCPPKNSIRPPGAIVESATKVRSSKNFAKISPPNPPHLLSPLCFGAPSTTSPIPVNRLNVAQPPVILNNRIGIVQPSPSTVSLNRLLSMGPSGGATAATVAPNGTAKKTLNIAASCSVCQVSFGSIHDLELHNRFRHNTPTPSAGEDCGDLMLPANGDNASASGMTGNGVVAGLESDRSTTYDFMSLFRQQNGF